MKFTKIGNIKEEEKIDVLINGKIIKAFKGETIASTLLSNEYFAFKKNRKSSELRGPFCGMGVCFECLVTVNKDSRLQACVTQIEEGMEIEIDEPKSI